MEKSQEKMIILRQKNVDQFGRFMRAAFYEQMATGVRAEAFGDVLQVMERLIGEKLGMVEYRCILIMALIGLEMGSSYVPLGKKNLHLINQIVWRLNDSRVERTEKILNALAARKIVIKKNQGDTPGYRIPILESLIKARDFVAVTAQKPDVKVKVEDSHEEKSEGDTTVEGLEAAGITEEGLEDLTNEGVANGSGS